MRKRIIAMFMCALLAVTPLFATGCGGQEGETSETEKEDPTKIQLNIGVFDGGFGSEWVTKIKNRFEADFADYQVGDKKGVQVFCTPDRSVVGMSSLLTLPYDVIFTEQTPYYNFALAGEMLDISDVVKSSVDGGSKTIEDKMYDAHKSYFNVGGKYYALPHYAGSYATFYDKDMFKKYSLYFAGDASKANKTAKYTMGADGKVYEFTDGTDTLSSGPNGIVGDFDDGLPATIDQFLCLCGKMVEQGISPITFSGTSTAYLTQWLTALAINLVPESEAELLWTNSGTSKYLIDSIAGDGTVTYMPETTVTPETGYISHRQAGRYYALSTVEKLINNGYLYSKTAGTYSHLEAQHSFILGTYKKVAKSVDKIGMLFDGTWFENESSAYYKEMAENGYGNDALKENRNIAIMPMPKLNEDNLGRNVMYDNLISSAFIPANIDSGKIEIAKEFLKYCYSDVSLREFTVTTGTLINMQYEFTDGDKAQLSNYTKSLIEMNASAKKIYPIASSDVYKNHQSTFIQTTYGWETYVNGYKFSAPMTFYRSNQLGANKTAINYINNLFDYYSETYWKGLV